MADATMFLDTERLRGRRGSRAQPAQGTAPSGE